MTAINPSKAAAQSRRPRSIKEAQAWGDEFGNESAYLREFLDEFYVEKNPAVRAEMLQEEPALGSDERRNAFLAAAAEHLALRNKLPVPEWTGHPVASLKNPGSLLVLNHLRRFFWWKAQQRFAAE